LEANPRAFLVGEVGNTHETIGPYLQSAMSACFDFDLSSLILDVIKNENAGSFNKKFEGILSTYAAYNRNFMDATFLSNHDQERVMSQLKGNTDKAVLAAAILLTLPGSPFIYYGEEIGMLGKKPDEHIREPMLFDSEKKDTMRTRWITPIYNTDATIFPAEAQKFESTSLLSRYQQLIILRKGIAALAYGKFEPSSIALKDVIGFFRTYNKQRCLVLHNLSSKSITLVMGDAEKNYTQSLYQTSKLISISNGQITLAPYASLVLREPAIK
jgi:glycosidase